MDDLREYLKDGRHADLLVTARVRAAPPCKRKEPDGDDGEGHPCEDGGDGGDGSLLARPPAAGEEQATFRLHRLVLDARCAPPFLRDVMEAAAPTSPPSPLRIPLHVSSAEELEALPQLWECIYGGSDTLRSIEPPSPARLTLLLKLAQFIGADAAMDQMLEHWVPKVDAEKMWGLAAAVPTVQLRPAWDKVARHLLTETGFCMDITEHRAWPDAERRRFLQMAFGLVLHWAKLDAVKCGSELDVLLLLDAWVAAHPETPPAQASQLAEHVRMCKLSTFWLSRVACNMGWVAPLIQRNLALWSQLVVVAFDTEKWQQLRTRWPAAPAGWLNSRLRAAEHSDMSVNSLNAEGWIAGLRVKVSIRGCTIDLRFLDPDAATKLQTEAPDLYLRGETATGPFVRSADDPLRFTHVFGPLRYPFRISMM